MSWGNKYSSFKDQIKELYLDFLDEPEHSERRVPNRGIYTSYSFGVSHKTVRIILLDVRYHKQSYFYDTDPDVLGEEQWIWLENTLKENNETFTFIVSGTQVLPFSWILSETWFTKSRNKLFDILGKEKKSGVVLLSGDIHSAQILKTFCILPGNMWFNCRNWLSYL